MRPPLDRQVTDPLLRPESALRHAMGSPARAPLGNSLKTFLVLGLLVAVGVAVWWVRRPDDLSAAIGGREWVITDVAGEPAVNSLGLVSTFVLDGNGEIRGPVACNVASGIWTYDVRRSALSIDWRTQTTMTCSDGWPTTYLPDGGDVVVGGSVMTIGTGSGEVRAVALIDDDAATVDEVAGSWTSGDQQIEIGTRGRFQVDDCEGSWEGLDEGAPMQVLFDELQRDDCELASVWRDETPLMPVVDNGVVYLRRDRSIFPLDREIVRLDPVP